MSGDLPPAELIRGCVQAVRKFKTNIVIIGDEALVQKELKQHQFGEDQIHVIPATEIIGMDEAPATACRAKKDASVMVGCRALHEGLIDAFMSPGNTGATLTAALMEVGRIKGVKRPALSITVATPQGKVMMLDIGANADCEPLYLRHFAILGATYVKHVYGVANPRIGLLNIGEEEGKGNKLAQDSFHEMKKLPFPFIGNIEPNYLFEHRCDVIVGDGFSGNLVIKSAEGMAKMIVTIIKERVKKSLKNKVGALLMQEVFVAMKQNTNPNQYGAAPLLGIQKPVYVGHGSSNADAIVSSVGACLRGLQAQVTEHMTEAIARHG